MSKETMTWLNNNTLIGFTEKRGNAWHYRASEQGTEPNHYVGAVPVEDVRRRLFHWQPVEAKVETSYRVGRKVVRIVDPSRKAIVRPDTACVLGIFKDSYKVHGYDEWLIRQAETIADADLQIGSAGLLRGGAVAWVQFELAETHEIAGVEYRPFLTAATSLDGSLSSTYLTGSQVVVCDNTLSASLSDKSHAVKIKHSSQSLGRISEVRDALGLVYQISDQFAAEVEALTQTSVTDRQWQAFLDSVATVDPKASQRARTIATNKREQLANLYAHDVRVAPWAGTAYGVLAAVNTWEHHYQTVRGMSRPERNALNVVTGQVDKSDNETLAALAKVLA